MSDGGIIDAEVLAWLIRVGRYFSVVSFIPSSLYILFVYLLVASGSWRHLPCGLEPCLRFARPYGVEGVVLLTFLGIGLGIFIRTIQFAIVQFFEGYWATWSIPQAIRYRRILYYQVLCGKLNDEIVKAINAEAANSMSTPVCGLGGTGRSGPQHVHGEL